MNVEEITKELLDMPRPHTKKTLRPHSKEDAQLGARLKAMRIERGLSQAELAVRSRMDQRMISCYELGYVRIPARELLKMAGILKMSIKEFAADKDRPPSKSKSRKLSKMMEKIETLPPREQKAIFVVLDSVLSKHISVSTTV